MLLENSWKLSGNVDETLATSNESSLFSIWTSREVGAAKICFDCFSLQLGLHWQVRLRIDSTYSNSYLCTSSWKASLAEQLHYPTFSWESFTEEPRIRIDFDAKSSDVVELKKSDKDGCFFTGNLKSNSATRITVSGCLPFDGRIEAALTLYFRIGPAPINKPFL